MQPQQALRSGEWEWDPLILDDHTILLHVRDKGLVVLTGRGHVGIVNTVSYAQKLIGIEQIYAIIGGYHLGGMTPEPIIQQICDALAAFAPEVIVPTHTSLASGRFNAWQTCSLTPSFRAGVISAIEKHSSSKHPCLMGKNDHLIATEWGVFLFPSDAQTLGEGKMLRPLSLITGWSFLERLPL